MKSHLWTMSVLFGASVGFASMASVAHAQISPVSPTWPHNLNTASPIKLLILDQQGNNITGSWRPTWDPIDGGAAGGSTTRHTVYVVVQSNGVDVPEQSVTGLSLVPPASVTAASFDGTSNPFLKEGTLTTSAYPGQCTNYGSGFTPDFDFGTAAQPVGARRGYPLTPRDCGGMAVINLTVAGSSALTFIVPQDTPQPSSGGNPGGPNGIPDVWENFFCPNNSCPTGKEDNDAGPIAASPHRGDGISALDEYRGFIVSTTHTPTDPVQKDLFVHLVNPQCVPAPPSGTDPSAYFLSRNDGILGQPPGSPKTVLPSDATSIFSNFTNLISGSQVHLLGFQPGATHYRTDEWIDNFHSYSDETGFVFTSDGPAKDRQINANAVYPVLDTGTGQKVQKGLRIVECVNPTTGSPLALAGLGTPNTDTNAILYTHKIVNYVTDLVRKGLPRRVRYFNYNPAGTAVLQSACAGVANPPVAGSELTLTDPITNCIISRALEFLTAMEFGHEIRLTPTSEGTRQTSYGFHHAPGTGTNLDQTIINKLDKTASPNTFNSFYIPLFYGGADQTNFKLND